MAKETHDINFGYEKMQDNQILYGAIWGPGCPMDNLKKSLKLTPANMEAG